MHDTHDKTPIGLTFVWNNAIPPYKSQPFLRPPQYTPYRCAALYMAAMFSTGVLSWIMWVGANW